MAQPKVLQAVNAIAREISAIGIAKASQNEQDGYSFRSIDDVRNALSPLLAKHKIVILPNATERVCQERRATTGMPLFYVTVQVRFEFASAEDGSTKEVVVYGEAMDVADKATGKAMAAAYKQVATDVFCIPTKGESDADKTTHNLTATLPSDERTKHERALLAAPDAAALKRAFTNATAAAKRAGDEESRKVFVAAREKRTKQLAEAKEASANKGTDGERK